MKNCYFYQADERFYDICHDPTCPDWYIRRFLSFVCCRRGGTSSSQQGQGRWSFLSRLSKPWTEGSHDSSDSTRPRSCHLSPAARRRRIGPGWTREMCLLECPRMYDCVWGFLGAEARVCRLHREALLHLTDDDILIDRRASWVEKRFRSNGSQMKETSRWVYEHTNASFTSTNTILMLRWDQEEANGNGGAMHCSVSPFVSLDG